MIDFNNKRILVTRLRFIGDIILTTPLLRTLKETYPNSYLAYMGEKDTVKLLESNPYLNKIIGFDFDLNFIEYVKFILMLRREKFDIVIDLFGNPRSVLLSFLSGAKIRIGGDFKGRGKLFTHRIEDDGIRRNAIQHHLRFIQLYGVNPSTFKTEIFLEKGEIIKSKEFLEQQGVNFGKILICIYPGATWPAKKWFPEKFAELADTIYSELNAQVLFLQSKDDIKIIEKIKQNIKHPHLFMPTMRLREVASVIKSCDLFISNDCGLLHISPAIGISTIGLFGPGEDDVWFPYDLEDGHISIRKDIWCHPCHLDFCNRMDCWKLLGVEEIIEKIKSLTN